MKMNSKQFATTKKWSEEINASTETTGISVNFASMDTVYIIFDDPYENQQEFVITTKKVDDYDDYGEIDMFGNQVNVKYIVLRSTKVVKAPVVRAPEILTNLLTGDRLDCRGRLSGRGGIYLLTDKV